MPGKTSAKPVDDAVRRLLSMLESVAPVFTQQRLPTEEDARNFREHMDAVKAGIFSDPPGNDGEQADPNRTPRLAPRARHAVDVLDTDAEFKSSTEVLGKRTAPLAIGDVEADDEMGFDLFNVRAVKQKC